MSKKDSNLEMKHFAIEAGHIRATNGTLTLGSPIDVDINCAPKAELLYHAIGKCKDVTSLKMTPTGRLSVVSGKFRALIPCVDMMSIPHPKPTGMRIDVDGAALLDAFDKLERFVGKDELRPFTNGILLRGQSAFATNNTCLVEYWLGVDVPTLNIPLQAVTEALRIGEAPTTCMSDGNTFTMLYPDNRWVKTLLLATEWPDLSHILDKPSSQVPVPEELFTGLDAVKAFDGDRRIWFTEDGVKAMATGGGDEAYYAVEGLHPAGCYRAEMLALIKDVATTADFSAYPEPVLFYGKNLRGAIMGLNP